MPHIDARSGEVVIRIVYDGAPEAGKTTNVHQLCNQISLQRRGAAKSPGTTGARTEFFDWLDFSGGYLDGRRVRCQLVSVPGQPRLLHRRRYLLEAADAIVFVADSRKDAMPDALHNVSATLRIAARVAGEIPVGVILQANKQDLAGAMTPTEVLHALGIPPGTPVVPSVASTGAGVMDTFILAVRLATDRVRLLLKETFTDLPTSEETPDALHSAMVALEPAEEAKTEPHDRPAAGPDAEPVVVEFSIDRATVPAPPEADAGRGNLLRRLEDVAVPQAQEISSGHVWPPVKGRSAFAIAVSGQLGVPDVVRPWAPAGALEITSDAGWVLHSSDRWVFETEVPARLHLLALVRRQLPQGELLPDARALAVARDGDKWRLWLLTPHIPSIRDTALDAVEQGSVTVVVAFLGQVAAAFRRVRDAGWVGPRLPAGAAGLALQDGRLVRLVLDEGEAEPTFAATTPLTELSDVMAHLTRDREGLREWFESEGRAVLDPERAVLEGGAK